MKKMLYHDSSRSIDDRLDDLMSRMTLEEKVGQMCQLDGRNEPEQWINDHHVGSFLHLIGEPANALQRHASEHTRLGIPLIFGIDAIHGHAFWPTATIFPTQLAVSCSWNPALAEEMGRITAKETACTGMHWTFSPVLGTVRDLRWGRVDETFGEDPFLIGELGAAIIRGYQGDDLSDPEHILACPKHYAGYPGSIGGRDSYEAELTKRSMRSLYLKPFCKAAEAGAATFMSGYHSIDGVVCTANRWLLHEVLKDEWGFEGFVITDWFNVGHMVNDQKVSSDLKDATRRAVEAGNDMSMTTPEFCELAVALVREGELDGALIDEGCRRVLRLKFMLGLFDERRYTDLSKQAEWIGLPEHRKAALEAAFESVVLLKNDGILPIQPTVKKIAVLGPNADDVVGQLGDWVSWEKHGEADGRDRPRELTTTVLDGIRARAGGIEVFFNRGCSTLADEQAQLRLMDVFEAGAGLFYEDMLSKMGEASIEAAVKLASEADLAVVVVGDNRPYIGEFRDRGNLDLSGEQQALLEAVKTTGTPMVVVLVNSKPLSIPWVAQEANAVVEAFNPGMLGGEVVAGLLFGDRDFTGKLTTSFPYHVGQLPVYYNHFPGWHGGKYVDMPAEPLYAFGYGLHYTTFVYSDLKVLTPTLKENQSLKVQVNVRNTGERSATEIVQLYINDVVSSLVTPLKELKAFARVELHPGEVQTVTLEVPFRELEMVNIDLASVVEAGMFEVMVGASSRDVDLLKAVFEVL